MIVWDHGRTPGCANSTIAAPRGPWQPYLNPTDGVHSPELEWCNKGGGIESVDERRQMRLTRCGIEGPDWRDPGAARTDRIHERRMAEPETGNATDTRDDDALSLLSHEEPPDYLKIIVLSK